jgi:L-seryl-tRNA(Ser) seleniumtransferase
MGKSGARLLEVGTTNRTHFDDYRRAASDATGIIVKVHRSNFAVAGFVAEASTTELGALATECGIPLLHDLGSGLLLSLDEFGLRGEPTARDALQCGGPATIVTMSGDKLLGGPQAGIIVGPRAAIDRVRRNPLTRSYRVDKLTLAALEATLALYRDPGRARREIPALAQLTCPLDELRRRAEQLRRDLGGSRSAIEIVDSDASVGGGAFPTARIPSIALAVDGPAATIERRLRSGEPPVIARIVDDRLLIDLRTVLPPEDADVVLAIRAALQ